MSQFVLRDLLFWRMKRAQGSIYQDASPDIIVLWFFDLEGFIECLSRLRRRRIFWVRRWRFWFSDRGLIIPLLLGVSIVVVVVTVSGLTLRVEPLIRIVITGSLTTHDCIAEKKEHPECNREEEREREGKKEVRVPHWKCMTTYNLGKEPTDRPNDRPRRAQWTLNLP